MRVDVRLIKLYGDQTKMQKRVDDFRQALRDHAKTEGISAPVEDETIEFLARGNHTIEPHDPDPPPSPPAPPTTTLRERVQKAVTEDPMMNAIVEAVAGHIGIQPATLISDIAGKVKDPPPPPPPRTVR